VLLGKTAIQLGKSGPHRGHDNSIPDFQLPDVPLLE
jgi:hypothetical protein